LLSSLFFSAHAMPAMDEDTTPGQRVPQRTHAPLPVLQLCQELSEMLLDD
jgi:hypothetical protein